MGFRPNSTGFCPDWVLRAVSVHLTNQIFSSYSLEPVHKPVHEHLSEIIGAYGTGEIKLDNFIAKRRRSGKPVP